jgi:hypothetical protein
MYRPNKGNDLPQTQVLCRKVSMTPRSSAVTQRLFAGNALLQLRFSPLRDTCAVVGSRLFFPAHAVARLCGCVLASRSRHHLHVDR